MLSYLSSAQHPQWGKRYSGSVRVDSIGRQVVAPNDGGIATVATSAAITLTAALPHVQILHTHTSLTFLCNVPPVSVATINKLGGKARSEGRKTHPAVTRVAHATAACASSSARLANAPGLSGRDNAATV